MKYIFFLCIVAFGLIGYTIASAGTEQSPLQKKVVILQKEVHSLQIQVKKLKSDVGALQNEYLTITGQQIITGQVIDSLRVRIEKLETTVYHQGN